jgi:hypothetical protein
MVLTVDLDKSNALGTCNKSEEIRVILATSIAMSDPFPIAIDKSACASAWLSLIPSPIIATTFPAACNFFTNSALSAGNTSAS